MNVRAERVRGPTRGPDPRTTRLRDQSIAIGASEKMWGGVDYWRRSRSPEPFERWRVVNYKPLIRVIGDTRGEAISGVVRVYQKPIFEAQRRYFAMAQDGDCPDHEHIIVEHRSNYWTVNDEGIACPHREKWEMVIKGLTLRLEDGWPTPSGSPRPLPKPQPERHQQEQERRESPLPDSVGGLFNDN